MIQVKRVLSEEGFKEYFLFIRFMYYFVLNYTTFQ